MPSELTNHPLWWSGLPWLHLKSEHWPHLKPIVQKFDDLEERIRCSVHFTTIAPIWELQSRFSWWFKLLRVTAYLFRFADRIRIKIQGQTRPFDTFLTPQEIQKSKTFWLKTIQSQLFGEELNVLRRKRSVGNTSSLAPLVPFLDANGLIRVRGRLSNTTWSDSAKHPIILKDHPLVRLIIHGIHCQQLHSGPQLTLSCSRQEYWFLRARSLIRAVLYDCVTCEHHNAKVPEELMGELPACRVISPKRTFLHTGLDYAGPLLVRALPGRGHKSHKAYISIFVCMATKALHLELVSDLTTAAFLAAFNRFTARRGIPTNMYSDNGTTFHGAHTELAAVHTAILNDPSFRNKEIPTSITWHFLPPRAPHFGGLWEAAVRSAKKHLVRSVGKQTLSIKEMMTLLCKIESCLNSRPIGPISDNIDDYSVLTPAHFLIGTTITSIPVPSVLEINENRLDRWQLVQLCNESFWRAWRGDYIHTLQQRVKGRKHLALARVGQIVLLKDSATPPSHWLLGRIIMCHPGQDGLTRVVTIKTATTTFKRPIKQLCFLPVSINQAEQKAVRAGGSP